MFLLVSQERAPPRFLLHIQRRRTVEGAATATTKTSRAKLLTMEEVAAYLGVKITTLYEWCALAKIEYIKVGRYTRFKPDHLDKWVTAHTVKARTHGTN
jgi:excisionase family DNA binding protein